MAIIVKPTGSPLWRPVPIIVRAWLSASSVYVAELTEVDSKWLPDEYAPIKVTRFIDPSFADNSSAQRSATDPVRRFPDTS
jgi:hypothetical protein